MWFGFSSDSQRRTHRGSEADNLRAGWARKLSNPIVLGFGKLIQPVVSAIGLGTCLDSAEGKKASSLRAGVMSDFKSETTRSLAACVSGSYPFLRGGNTEAAKQTTWGQVVRVN